jgi:hypothetical protein
VLHRCAGASSLPNPRVLTPSGARVEEAIMLGDSVLRQKAQAAIRNGSVPVGRPDRTWGGPGIGAPCAVCDLPVTKGEMEYEFEMKVAHDGDNSGSDKFHVHIQCFAMWEFARAVVLRPVTTGLSDDELRRQVRARLSEGRLGSVDGVSRSHRGTGRPCIVCRRTIAPTEVEREVNGQGVALHAHEACYKPWREESVARRAATGPVLGRGRTRRGDLYEDRPSLRAAT